jgi:ADP-heptose:LPS heptosyltransferase
MMRSLVAAIRSLLKLLGIVVREAAGAAKACLRGDLVRARAHVFRLSDAVHLDLAQAMRAVNGRLYPTLDADIDRILIIKLDRIGDMVNTTPVFDVLRERFPNARLDIVGHPGPLALLEGDERVGERIPYRCWLYHPGPPLFPGPRTWLLVLRLLWRRYPLVIYLRGSLPFLALGLVSKLAVTRFVPDEWVVTRYFNALESVLGPVPRYLPRLRVPEEATRSVGEMLAAESDADRRPRVAIHAAANTAGRTYPAESFAALADALVTTFGACVSFLGSPADRPLFARIASRCAHTHTYHSALRLPQVAAFLAACDVFVGNDSGLAHMACAVETPTVVLWGAVSLSMSRPAAPPERCIVLYHEIACRPTCPEQWCVNPTPFECLQSIQVGEIVSAVGRLLQPSAPGSPPPPGRIPLLAVSASGAQPACDQTGA